MSEVLIKCFIELKMNFFIAFSALIISSQAIAILPATYNVVSPDLVPPAFHAVPGIIQGQGQDTPLPHPLVVENAIAESQLPQELLNPFYKNPAIGAALAKESWFTNKEFPVYHRDTDKIPRSEIFKLITRLQHKR